MNALLDSTKQAFSRQPSSPEEIKDSREARDKLKESIDQARKDYLNATIQNKSKGFTESDFAPIKERIDKSQQWVTSNLRPFAQDSLDQIDLLRNDLKDTYLNIAEKKELDKKNAPPKPIDDTPPPPVPPKPWDEKTTTDIVQDAAWIVFKWSIVLILLGFAVRAGAFAANQSLHLDVPYRILNFVYGTLLWFYTIPYYTWQWAKSKLGWREPLIQESILPLYESPAPVTDFFDSAFSWFRSPELAKQLNAYTTQLQEDRAAALGSAAAGTGTGTKAPA